MHDEILFRETYLLALVEYLLMTPGRNEPTLEPSRDSGRIAMAEQTGSSVHTTKFADHVLSLGRGLVDHARIYTLKTYDGQTWKAYT